jgi:hypothetical protein
MAAARSVGRPLTAEEDEDVREFERCRWDPDEISSPPESVWRLKMEALEEPTAKPGGDMTPGALA